MKLATPGNLRKLQKALYLRAKESPKFRFYSLYDKVYREDVLRHAWALCRANHGAAGPDGKTFEDIERDGVEALLTRLTEYPAWSRVSERKLRTEHGLLSWARTPSWDKQAACARR